MRLLVIASIVVGACESDLDGTAFKCDADRGCPDGQSCITGRCRRVAPVAIGCDPQTCGPEQQCCVDIANGNRCIGATDVCPGATALCDGVDDCGATERCCNGSDTTVCALSCESDSVACATDADCPSDAIHCCPQPLVPWGECSNIDCPSL